MRTYHAGKPFRCAVNGPDVCVGTAYPVVENGGGWVRVVALATCASHQQNIVDAMNVAAEEEEEPGTIRSHGFVSKHDDPDWCHHCHENRSNPVHMLDQRKKAAVAEPDWDWDSFHENPSDFERISA